MDLLEKFKNFSKKGKLAVLFATAGVVGLTSYCGIRGHKKDSETKETKLYLVDITDKYEDEIVLKDKDGNKIEINDASPDKLLAITDSKKHKKNKKYQVILVDDEGVMQSGYIEGKYLSDDVLDTEKLVGEFCNDVSIISSPSGGWFRKEAKVDKDTDDAVLLDYNQNLAVSNHTYHNDVDSYAWSEGVTYVDGDLKVGFIATENVASKDYDKIKGKKFTVSTEDGSPLKLRDEASIDGEIIYSIPNNSEVVLLSGYPSVSDENHDWFYVAVNTEDGVKIGYSCATYHPTDGTAVNYLIEKEEEKTDDVTTEENTEQKENNNEYTYLLRVNTDSDGGVPLKLREGMGTSYDIISELENGAKLFTSKKEMEESKNNLDENNTKWIKVRLTSGEVGYVCASFVEEYEKKQEYDDSIYTINFGDEGQKEGYMGLDVPIPTDYVLFEKLLREGNDYYDKERGTVIEGVKPSFVIIKMGATYTSLADGLNENRFANISQDNVKELADLCEQYEIPFGFYYFSQALTTDEADKEVDYIKRNCEQYKNYTYNVMPLYYDYEYSSEDTRLYVYAKEGNKENLTQVLNYAMNKLRLETEHEVCLYSDKNALNEIFNYDDLDDINKQNMWVVAVNDAHSNGLVNNFPEAADNVSVRQYAHDGEINEVKFDINLMDKDYYENIMKNNLGISKKLSK